MKLTPAQELLRIHLKELGVETRPEFRFSLERKFRFDLYAESLRMGFECDGGFQGRHRSGHLTKKAKERKLRLGQPLLSPLEEDYARQNLAQLMGYRVMRFTNRQVETGEAKAFLQEWLGEKKDLTP